MQILTPVRIQSSADELREQVEREPGNLIVARQWAEIIHAEWPPETARAGLLAAANRFPRELRLKWLLLQTELKLHRYKEAAATALDLAGKVRE